VRTKDQEEEKSKRYKYVKNNNDFYIDIWEEKRSRTTENKREKRIWENNKHKIENKNRNKS